MSAHLVHGFLRLLGQARLGLGAARPRARRLAPPVRLQALPCCGVRRVHLLALCAELLLLPPAGRRQCIYTSLNQERISCVWICVRIHHLQGAGQLLLWCGSNSCRSQSLAAPGSAQTGKAVIRSSRRHSGLLPQRGQLCAAVLLSLQQGSDGETMAPTLRPTQLRN